jgi:signal transduction histidine kinase
VLVVIGMLGLAALTALAWVVALRRRVARQTAQIGRHVHQQTVSEERMRIARELHDSLEQDLLGITMQLKATEKLLDRPDRARNSLQLASAMVRRSQAETHRAVWDLREQQAGLVPTLRSAVAGLTTGGGGRRRRGRGARRHRPRDRHRAGAAAADGESSAPGGVGGGDERVQARGRPGRHGRRRVRAGRVVLTVRDDGHGFDADSAPTPSSGHFGLFGMRERAEKLHGELTIASRPGEGTTVRLVAPTGGNGAAAAAKH